MRLKGSAEVLEQRRRKALELLQEDMSLHEVARRIGCHPSSVLRWRDRKQAFGEQGLKVRSSPGRPSRLSREQKQRLLEVLLQGPAAFRWRTQVWTTGRIAQLIESQFNVVYHTGPCGANPAFTALESPET